MKPDAPALDLIISQVFDRWPATTRVFIKHRMACVGCPMSGFMTLEDAIQIYRLPPAQFLDELRQAIGEQGGQSSQ
jgi:hybrid cluster-associated redox disulfide protein